MYMYSGTSVKGPSENGTTSLQRTLPHFQLANRFSMFEMRTASLQGTKWLAPKCPLLNGSTVYNYTCTMYKNTCKVVIILALQWDLHIKDTLIGTRHLVLIYIYM